MKIAIGCDHAAFELKTALAGLLKSQGHEVLDMGTNGPESVDYPDFARAVCEAVLSGKAERGVLICGTGIGMSIAANRFAGIRAALCSEPLSARLSRQHNNSNVLCLGARLIGTAMAEEVLGAWLNASFEGGRHGRRVEKLSCMGAKK